MDDPAFIRILEKRREEGYKSRLDCPQKGCKGKLYIKYTQLNPIDWTKKKELCDKCNYKKEL